MRLSHPDLLAEEAFAWVAQRATLVPQPVYVNPEHRWRIRSALQKAVRRGQTERAIYMGLALHRLDSRALWRAILTIALEDVGVGGPDTVLWATAAQRATFRRAVGEQPLAIALIREMAGSPKSRAAVEIAFVADTSEQGMFAAFARSSTRDLIERTSADDSYEAYAALSVLRGIVPGTQNPRAPDERGWMEACVGLCDGLPDNVARALRATVARPLDNMSLGFSIACRVWSRESPTGLVEDAMPPSVQINGFPAEAFDQHERQRKQAIRRFGAELRAARRWVAGLPQGSFYPAVADAVFIEEGQCLDRWLSGGKLMALREMADRCTLTRHSLSEDEGDALRRVVQEEIERLHAHRLAVVHEGLQGARLP